MDERIRYALSEAYRLLVYAAPDTELINATEWTEDCDKWLDEFAPSKLKDTYSAAGDEHAG